MLAAKTVESEGFVLGGFSGLNDSQAHDIDIKMILNLY